MFWNKKSGPRLNQLDSLLGSGFKLDAKTSTIEFFGSIKILGIVTGTVAPAAADTGETTIIVGHGAIVTGSLKADHIIIDGIVNGSVEAIRTLAVLSNGSITGDVVYNEMSMKPGAKVLGRLHEYRVGEGDDELDRRIGEARSFDLITTRSRLTT